LKKEPLPFRLKRTSAKKGAKIAPSGDWGRMAVERLMKKKDP